MAYIPPNPNGSATSANSAPVVIASDQAAVAVKNSTAVNLKVDPSGVTSPVSLATNTPTLQSGSTTTVTQATGTNLHTVVDSGTITLPTGASTAAKQPAIGTAGTPSADVLTVQGVTSMIALKVDPSAVTSPVSLASVPSHPVTNAGTFAVQSAPTADTTPATQNITAQDIASTTATTNANSQSFRTGAPTANSTALFTLSSWKTVSVQVTGTWTGNLLIEGSLDGGTTFYQKAVKQIGTSYIANNFTANFAGTVNVASLTHLAIRSTATMTGTATVAVRESLSDNGVYIHNGLTLQDATIQTNKMTIKSASTAAVATDPAVVVAISPNNTVSLAANQTINEAQINGVTPLMGNGVTGTGSQRVTIASDNTAFSVNSNQGTAAAPTGGWPTINGELGDVTGTFTNATQTTSVTASGLVGYGNTLISINGTYGTATAVFEGSDDSGTTWYSVQAARDNTNVIELGYTSLTNTNQTWQINNPGFDSIRVRSTAVASGTVNVRLSSSAAPVASGTIVGIGTALPAGSAVIGHVIADTGSTTAVTQATGTNLHAVLDSGTLTTLTTLTGTTTLTPGTAAANLGKAEDAAAASGDTGVMTLGVRNDSLTAAQTNANGDYGAYSIDTSGILITAGAPRALKARQSTTITSSTAETTIVTAIGSTFCDIYGLVLTNTSATTTKVSIRDATAGGTITVFEVPAGDTRGFMGSLDSAVPQAAVNNNWTAQCGTSVASLEVSVFYVKRV